MMIGYVCILLCTSSFVHAQSPTEFTLGEVDFELDREFDLMDQNKDGTVNQQEFDITIEQEDKDRNGCVSMKEYFDYHPDNPATFEWQMFQHFDHNQDGCLEVPDMKEEFNEIDLKPKDGLIEIHELVVYYEKLYEKIGVVENQ